MAKAKGKAAEEKAQEKRSVRIREGAWKDLRIAAVSEGRSTGDVLADAIALYLKSKGGR
jgi:hypothetical protein